MNRLCVYVTCIYVTHCSCETGLGVWEMYICDCYCKTDFGVWNLCMTVPVRQALVYRNCIYVTVPVRQTLVYGNYM